MLCIELFGTFAWLTSKPGSLPWAQSDLAYLLLHHTPQLRQPIAAAL